MRRDWTTWAAFIGAVLIGGANFIAVSVSNETLPPLFGAALRFAMGSALFFGLLAVARVPIARGRSVAGAVLYGALGFGAAYALLYTALVGLTAGMAAVVVASAPLFTIIIASLFGQERLTARGLIGALLIVVGIAIISRGTLDGSVDARYLLAAVAGSVAIASSSVLARSLRGVHPLNVNAIGMAAGTLLLVVGSVAFGETWSVPRESRTWFALAWLVVLGSVGLFQLFLFVVGRWSASAAAYVVAGMPLVAILLGWALLRQPITGDVVLGAAIVIAAVVIGSGARRVPAAPDRP